MTSQFPPARLAYVDELRQNRFSVPASTAPPRKATRLLDALVVFACVLCLVAIAAIASPASLQSKGVWMGLAVALAGAASFGVRRVFSPTPTLAESARATTAGVRASLMANAIAARKSLNTATDLLSAAVDEAAKSNTPITVALVDVDLLWSVKAGSVEGLSDDEIRTLADRLARSAQAYAMTATAGPRQWALIMEATDLHSAMDHLEGSVREVQAKAAPRRPVAVNAGVAEWSGPADTAELMLRRALNGVNCAKRSPGGAGAVLIGV